MINAAGPARAARVSSIGASQLVAMVVRLAALLPRDWVGIVESDQPLALRAGQRERVVDAVRLLRQHRRPRYPDAVAALRVHHENLPAEVEKRIERRVAPLLGSRDIGGSEESTDPAPSRDSRVSRPLALWFQSLQGALPSRSPIC